MSDFKSILIKLRKNLDVLQEREAKYGGVPPLELLNQIQDHQQAIALTEEAIEGHLTKNDWHQALRPMLVFQPDAESFAPVPRPLFPIGTEDYRDLVILHKKVTTFWIDGVLKKSIHNQVLLDLGKIVDVEAVEHPWERILEFPDQTQQHLPVNRKNIDIFDEMNRALLILGEPGAGKTVTLLELTRNLAEQFEADERLSLPVPTVFNLSSWTYGQSLIDWLVIELSAKYQIPKRIGRSWLENNRLLPLLDGLDEVRLDDRAACVEAINYYNEEFGLKGLVVSSRLKEYTELPVRLKLNGAIRLQPLTPEQIDRYLRAASPSLDALRTILRDDEGLLKLAQSPLMLSIMSLAYQNQEEVTFKFSHSLGRDTAELRRKHLFDTYIKQMFRRRSKRGIPYSDRQTIIWLKWLANGLVNLSESQFLIEDIQPDWASTAAQGWLYSISLVLVTALPFGVLLGIGIGYPVWLAIPALGRYFGLGVGLSSGLAIWLSLRRDFGLSGSLLVGLCFGLTFGLAFKTSHGLTIGLNVGLATGIATAAFFGLVGRQITKKSSASLNKIEPVEILSWSWQKASFGLLIGVVTGFVLGLGMGRAIWPPISMNFGLAFGLAAGSVAGLLGGLTGGKTETRISPNQGVWQSARNAIIIGLLIALSVGLPIGVVSGSAWSAIPIGNPITVTIVTGSTIGLAFGMITALYFGGLTFLQHFTLRTILFLHGDLPWNLSRFLDYASDRIFLRKVGGGYIFVHRLLMEHFAEMEFERK